MQGFKVGTEGGTVMLEIYEFSIDFNNSFFEGNQYIVFFNHYFTNHNPKKDSAYKIFFKKWASLQITARELHETVHPSG